MSSENLDMGLINQENYLSREAKQQKYYTKGKLRMLIQRDFFSYPALFSIVH